MSVLRSVALPRFRFGAHRPFVWQTSAGGQSSLRAIDLQAKLSGNSVITLRSVSVSASAKRMEEGRC
jgi:hypothetical protein